MDTYGPPVHFLNVSYFFELIYSFFFAAKATTLGTGGLWAFLMHLWVLVTILSFLLTLVLLGILVYYSIRLRDVTQEEDEKFAFIPEDKSKEEVKNARWAYIRQLIESTQESDWRNAIIEADIMLDEVLSKQGYQGDTVADKLKTANPSHFRSLDDAWTAHRVRNDIAHQGSSFPLTDHLAYQTIGRYQNVFQEFGEI